MKLSVIKIDNALYPVGDQSIDDMAHINSGEYVIDVKMHRNPKFHRKAFALLNMIFDSQETFEDFKIFRAWATMKAGYVYSGVAPNGTPIFIPESLSFESMPQDKFEKWYNRVIDVAVKEYGMDKEFLNRVMAYA